MGLPVTPALQGKHANSYREIAEQFQTAPSGFVQITDFGDPQRRFAISPRIAHLARRSSEKIRVELGLSRRAHGKVYGAIMRHKMGQYQWVPDFVWPAAGEVDPGVLRAAERARLRENNTVKAEPRVHQPELDDSTPSETPSEAPQSVVEAPLVPDPVQAPVVALEAPEAPLVANGCHVLADTGNMLVLQYDGNIIVADVTTRTAIR